MLRVNNLSAGAEQPTRTNHPHTIPISSTYHRHIIRLRSNSRSRAGRAAAIAVTKGGMRAAAPVPGVSGRLARRWCRRPVDHRARRRHAGARVQAVGGRNIDDRPPATGAHQVLQGYGARRPLPASRSIGMFWSAACCRATVNHSVDGGWPAPNPAIAGSGGWRGRVHRSR
jgi:hypothetical protein